MAVHMLLLAAPAAFLQAYQLSFLLWPFNLALPMARDLPRACITLQGILSFYAAGLRGGQGQGQQQLVHGSSAREDAVAHAMLAFDVIY